MPSLKEYLEEGMDLLDRIGLWVLVLVVFCGIWGLVKWLMF